MDNNNQDLFNNGSNFTMGYFQQPKPANAVFIGDNELEILRLEPDGKIYVKGELVETNEEVVNGLIAFLRAQGHQDLVKKEKVYVMLNALIEEADSGINRAEKNLNDNQKMYYLGAKAGFKGLKEDLEKM